MRGPIDYLIVEFAGNKFTGEVIAELQKAVDNGTIDVLAVTVIAKTEDGTLSVAEPTEEDLPLMESFKLNNALIDDDDVQEVGEMLENNSAAGLLVIEQLWAKGLKQAIINAGGTLLAEGRIHPDASEELNQEEEA